MTDIKIILNGSTVVEMPISSYKVQITPLKPTDDLKIKINFMTVQNDVIFEADGTLRNLLVMSEEESGCVPMPRAETPTLITPTALTDARAPIDEIKQAPRMPIMNESFTPIVKKYKTIQKVYTTFAFLCTKFRRFHLYVHGVLYFNIRGSLIRFKSLLVAEACQGRLNYQTLEKNEIIVLVSDYINSICCSYTTSDIPANYVGMCGSIAEVLDQYLETCDDI